MQGLWSVDRLAGMTERIFSRGTKRDFAEKVGGEGKGGEGDMVVVVDFETSIAKDHLICSQLKAAFFSLPLVYQSSERFPRTQRLRDFVSRSGITKEKKH